MSTDKDIFMLTAMRNEGPLVSMLLEEIHQVFAAAGLLERVLLVIVDDHSVDKTVEIIADYQSEDTGLAVEVIRLQSNRGNQSAMAYGLRKMSERFSNGMLLTFDADGEDDLTRLPELVTRLEQNPERMVFVYRESRADSWHIRLFYWFYKLVYFFFTGQKFLPCNLMAVPGHMVRGIADSPLLPLHFSYPPLRLRLPHEAMPMARRERYGSHSSQNIGMLVQHALTGLTIFYEQVISRVLLMAGSLIALMMLIAMVTTVVKIVSPSVVPVGLPTLLYQALFGFGFLSMVLFVLFCLVSSILKLLIEQGRDS